ncbi:helix-turn-helix domain-containing protein [Veillonella magna]|uniref:Helix-turn-helix domain-containing protein n=1 Tax=Veillonella magna TaxID=464322 RepID=A0ABS2GIJ7_9FIRM|nr:helix-turn-helix domain-containing protein [Veillonella magna]MBM6825362.1 helix-turn-helix domain-containing protein [Veillonella magna]MBM6913657.1 helix-turn-helix domain-containing protein [Veillonella magna]
MKLYTVREAAEEYFTNNISISHLYNLIKRKNLNCIFIGHKILIPEEALDDFCQKNLNQVRKDII